MTISLNNWIKNTFISITGQLKWHKIPFQLPNIFLITPEDTVLSTGMCAPQFRQGCTKEIWI